MIRNSNEVTSPLIVKLKNFRNKLQKKWSKDKTAMNWVNLIRASRNLRKEVNKLRTKLLKGKMNKGTKEFWMGVKSLMGVSTNNLDKLMLDGSETDDKQIIANAFIKEFTGKVNYHLDDYVATKNVWPCDSFEEISSLEVRKAILRLSNKKSWGMDNIPCFLVRKWSSVLEPFLVKLFNLIISKNQVPPTWKIARIIPVFKKGASTDIKNYRPVSNLSAIAKVFEICILSRFERLDFDNIMSPYQHGFRKLHSTETALAELVGNISDGLDNKRKICVYSADLTAAFDLLRLDKLSEILEEKGIPTYLLNIINEYLSDRSGYVEISEHRSMVEPIRAGCVQGSIIGPLLFNILMSNLHTVIRPHAVVSYADDSYVVVSAANRDELLENTRLCMIEHYGWLKSIGMVCNTSKTEMMAFGVDEFEIRIDNEPIKSTETMKALGVMLDNKLNWESHVTKIIQKCRSLLFAFRYIRRHLDIPEIKFILNAHLVSRLSYASPVWSHSINHKLKLKLRSVFYNTLRVILRDFERNMSRQSMAKSLEMEDIITTFEKRTSVFIFKIVTNLSPLNLTQKFLTKSYTNERKPERVEFFNTSSTKHGKLCITNAAKKIVDTWNFDWLYMSLYAFKEKIRAQFRVV